MALTWPPTLDDFKADLPAELSGDQHDAKLTQVLDAAIDYVQNTARTDLNYSVVPNIDVDQPDNAVCLGTLRLARRWHERRRSPDGMISAQEFGATRVSSGDQDIDRMLRVGRYAGMRFA
jgi:hypothetical protein